ncbi:hypothetical protein VKT23_018735 [Stygiomarasmius scandens]|uniref:Uncharacterized protein n=1 Tax=Marasmiellus scandens TaxID=2682957 RepID=A0ABR1IR64_9AGAR
MRLFAPVRLQSPGLFTVLAASKVYCVTELFCAIVHACDFEGKQRLAAVCQRSRDVVCYELQLLAAKVLSNYVSSPNLLQNFHCLFLTSESIIIGSPALIVAGLTDQDDGILVIGVSLRRKPHWQYWAKSFGWTKISIEGNVNEDICQAIIYTFQSRMIILAISPHDTAVNVLRTFRETASMTFLTATRLYVGYPKLTLRNVSLEIPDNTHGWNAGWGSLFDFSRCPVWIDGFRCVQPPRSFLDPKLTTYMVWGGLNLTRVDNTGLSSSCEQFPLEFYMACPCQKCHSMIVVQDVAFQELVCLVHHELSNVFGSGVVLKIEHRELRDELYNHVQLTPILQRFFLVHEISPFLLMLDELEVIISGSTPLLLFTGERWSNSDLDLYVELRNAEDAGLFLLCCNYEYISLPRQATSFPKAINACLTSASHPQSFNTDYPLPGILDVFSFARNGKTVQLIVCKNSPIEVILAFHSTCVMNIITYHFAIFFYPISTLLERQSVIIPNEWGAHKPGVLKYHERGWLCRASPTVVQYLSPYNEMSHVVRHVGDAFCYCHPLTERARTEPFSVIYPSLAAHSWNLRMTSSSSATMSFSVGSLLNHKKFCVSTSITSAGKFQDKRHTFHYLSQLAWHANERLSDSYTASLEISSRLLHAIRIARSPTLEDCYLMDSVRQELGKTVSITGCLPNITCTIEHDTVPFKILVKLSWTTHPSRNQQGCLRSWSLSPPVLWSLYKQAQHSFWTAEEIDLSHDVKEWKELLTVEERRFLSRVLAFFATADGLVAENVAQNFSVEVQIPEARYFYGFQVAMENIHAETYSLLIETLISDSQERHHLFRAFAEIPSIRAKAEWATTWMNEHSVPFSERLLAFAFVEGVFFSSSFASIFWLKKRGLMPGLCFSNELISRDEGLHTEFACVLFRKLSSRPSNDRVIEILEEAVALEKLFVADALRVDLIGMNSKLMTDYVEFVGDCILQMLGVPARFLKPNPFDFMDLISLRGKANFFERRVSEYQVGSLSKPMVL